MAKAKIAPPKGYDNDDEFLEEARTRFLEGEGFDRLNREAALDDLRFFAGDQWDAATKERREKQGRPCLTINRLPQFVAQVVGDIRINTPAIKVRPAEDGDEDVAETRQGLIRYIEHNSNAQAVYTLTGQTQTICGISNFRLKMEYADDGTFDQDIFIRPVPNPFAVIWDPLAIDSTGKDARYCFVVDEMPRKAFEAKYPDHKPDEVSTLGLNLWQNGWLTKDVVRVTEYWTIKETTTELAKLIDGTIVKLSDVHDPKTIAKKRKVITRSACMYLISGHAILDGPYELPISRLPIFRVEGWKVWVGEQQHRFGLTRFAKDPQRLMNYWRSVAAETLALAPRQQWLLHQSNDKGQATDDFRDAHLSGDPVLIWQGQTEPKRMDPPAFPAALSQEAQLNAQDIKDVTGLHDASLGAQSNETSGKAILARDRQGDVATYIYPDNLKAAIVECGQCINDLIPTVYDTARTLTIIGEDEKATQKRVNDPGDPQSKDITKGKYHTVIDTGPSYTTKRVEAAESMIAFVQAVPQVAAVAGDLIAKAQDWPLAEEIGQRIERSLPPQITHDPNDPNAPQPPPPSEAEQRAAHMQDQAMQLDLEQKRAQTAKATADAGISLHNLGMLHGEAEASDAFTKGTEQLFGQGMAPPEQPATPPPPLGQ